MAGGPQMPSAKCIEWISSLQLEGQTTPSSSPDLADKWELWQKVTKTCQRPKRITTMQYRYPNPRTGSGWRACQTESPFAFIVTAIFPPAAFATLGLLQQDPFLLHSFDSTKNTIQDFSPPLHPDAYSRHRPQDLRFE